MKHILLLFVIASLLLSNPLEEAIVGFQVILSSSVIWTLSMLNAFWDLASGTAWFEGAPGQDAITVSGVGEERVPLSFWWVPRLLMQGYCRRDSSEYSKCLECHRLIAFYFLRNTYSWTYAEYILSPPHPILSHISEAGYYMDRNGALGRRLCGLRDLRQPCILIVIFTNTEMEAACKRANKSSSNLYNGLFQPLE